MDCHDDEFKQERLQEHNTASRIEVICKTNSREIMMFACIESCGIDSERCSKPTNNDSLGGNTRFVLDSTYSVLEPPKSAAFVLFHSNRLYVVSEKSPNLIF